LPEREPVAAPGRAADGAARHGVAIPRGQRLPGARGGRFGRMFGFLPERDPGAEAIDALVALIARSGGIGENRVTLPAGYTYLAQFVDHDITFDPTSKLQRDNDPGALVNFRTPRFDLDSLYGSGPKDQPYLYDWLAPDPRHRGVKLLVGDNAGHEGCAKVDLPRNAQGRALIGDARNDENLIVSQLHLQFIHFHNAVVEWVLEHDRGTGDDELLDEAQRVVRWHYQWIVVDDLLRRLAGKDMLDAVLQRDADGLPRVVRRFFAYDDEPSIPVEFSAAAYRIGHTMVRSGYFLKDAEGAPSVPIFPDRTTDPDGSKLHLGGFRRLLADLEIDWDVFFFAPADAARKRSNHSLKLDTDIADPLSAIPPDGASLPFLNLSRGRALGLPSGADVALAMGLDPLEPAQLGLDELVPEAAREALERATPLWFYILCEAQLAPANGFRLGPVGGRIVAEVLLGLLEADPSSWLRQSPAWTPVLPRADERRFTMLDLLRFTGAIDGK
jgi:Arc/MetJ family transcription regulator